MGQKSLFNSSGEKLIPGEIVFKKHKGNKPSEDIVEMTIFYVNGGKLTYVIPDIYLGFEFDKHYSLTDIYGDSKKCLPPEIINEH